MCELYVIVRGKSGIECNVNQTLRSVHVARCIEPDVMQCSCDQMH